MKIKLLIQAVCLSSFLVTATFANQETMMKQEPMMKKDTMMKKNAMMKKRSTVKRSHWKHSRRRPVRHHQMLQKKTS